MPVTVEERRQRLAAIDAVRAIRALIQPVTQEEIHAWKQEGRR